MCRSFRSSYVFTLFSVPSFSLPFISLSIPPLFLLPFVGSLRRSSLRCFASMMWNHHMEKTIEHLSVWCLNIKIPCEGQTRFTVTNVYCFKSLTAHVDLTAFNHKQLLSKKAREVAHASSRNLRALLIPYTPKRIPNPFEVFGRKARVTVERKIPSYSKNSFQISCLHLHSTSFG